MISRIAYAVLAGVIAMVACYLIASVFKFDVLNQYAALIGLLVAVVVFFSGRTFGNRV